LSSYKIKDAIFSIALTHNDRFLISASKDQSIRVWDLMPRKDIQDIVEQAHDSKFRG